MGADADLTSENIRALSDKLSELTVDRLEHYIEDSGASTYDNNAYASKRDRLHYMLEEGNGSDEIRKFLSITIKGEYDFEDQTFFEQALEGSRFIVKCPVPGELKLLVDHSKVAGEKLYSHQSYLEEHAPGATLEKFEKAQEKLAEGDRGMSLHLCRMALESMTHSDFGEALDQLESEGLIEQIDQNQESPYTNKAREYRFIYTAYSWTSWLGSHTSADGVEPSSDQAEIGISITGEALYYILRKLEEAASNDLDKWVSV